MVTRRRGWRVQRFDEYRVHVYPLKDLREHELSAGCWCDPTVQEVKKNSWLITHQAEDGRDLVERHGLQ